MQTPTIVLLDEINCKLINFNRNVLTSLNKKFEYAVPNARFSPKFTLGIWDGTISYFSKSGESYIYLLKDIIPYLLKAKIEFLVDDRRSKSKLLLEPINKHFFDHHGSPATHGDIILRDYQVESINKLIYNKGGIGVFATGAGKTLITACICKVFNLKKLKCLIIVPSISLVIQTKKTFINCNLDTGELTGKLKDPNHETVVSTWQTLQNIKPIMTEFDMVLVDEAHQTKANVIKSLIETAGRNIKYRFGLTGTMPKDEIDQISIHTVLGDIVHTIKAKTLIDAGYLANLHIQINQLVENFEDQYNNFKNANKRSKMTYSHFKNSYFPDYQSEKTYLRTNTKRINYISNLLIERSKSGNVFALIDNIQFGKTLLKAIKSKYDNEHIYFVSGNDEAKNRQKIYDLFEHHDNIITIATVQCAGVGTDVSRIYQLFLIDLGKSFIRTIQAIGRGLRTAPDKNFVDVVDICSDLKYSKRHISERIKFYKEAGYPNKKNIIKY